MPEMDILEIGETARMLEISIETLRVWADEGKIKHFKTTGGRRMFQRRDVERFMKSRDEQKAS